MHKGLLEALGRHQRELEAKGQGDVDVTATWASPLNGEEQDAVLNAAFDRVEPERSRRSASSGDFIAFDSMMQSASKRFLRRAWIGGFVAAAAVIALWFGWPKLHRSFEAHRTLPSYSIVAFTGGIAEFRSSTEHSTEGSMTELTLSPDDRIDWKFAPKSSVQGGVEVGVLATMEGGETRWVPLEGVEVSETGSVRMHAPLSSFVNLHPGNWTLVLYFASSGELPANLDQARKDGPWQKMEVRLNVTMKP